MSKLTDSIADNLVLANYAEIPEYQSPGNFGEDVEWMYSYVEQGATDWATRPITEADINSILASRVLLRLGDIIIDRNYAEKLRSEAVPNPYVDEALDVVASVQPKPPRRSEKRLLAEAQNDWLVSVRKATPELGILGIYNGLRQVRPKVAQRFRSNIHIARAVHEQRGTVEGIGMNVEEFFEQIDKRDHGELAPEHAIIEDGKLVGEMTHLDYHTFPHAFPYYSRWHVNENGVEMLRSVLEDLGKIRETIAS
jgi:hypothetical protein